MKYISSLIFLLFSFVSISQESKTTFLDYNKKEVRKKKKASYKKVVLTESNKVTTTLVKLNSNKIIQKKIEYPNTNELKEIEFYFNGNVQYETQYKNGLKNGEKKYYSYDNRLIFSAFYLDDKYNGTYTEYFKDGSVKKRINYIQDKKNGLSVYYHKNGQINDSINYKNDERNGAYKSYYENGKLFTSSFYVSGKIEGNDLGFSQKGNLIDSSNYKDGKRTGTHFKWFEEGNKRYESKYTDGKKEGETTSFYLSGKLKRKDVYKSDSLIAGDCFASLGLDTTYYDYYINPVFEGGEAKLFEFLGKNVRYPQLAKESGVSGRVYVQFIVEKDGSIDDVEILRGLGAGINEECERIMKIMPNWTPGYEDGNPVRVRFVLPINFSLR